MLSFLLRRTVRDATAALGERPRSLPLTHRQLVGERPPAVGRRHLGACRHTGAVHRSDARPQTGGLVAQSSRGTRLAFYDSPTVRSADRTRQEEWT